MTPVDRTSRSSCNLWMIRVGRRHGARTSRLEDRVRAESQSVRLVTVAFLRKRPIAMVPSPRGAPV